MQNRKRKRPPFKKVAIKKKKSSGSRSGSRSGTFHDEYEELNFMDADYSECDSDESECDDE